MNISQKLTQTLTSTYALVERTGITEYQWFQSLFVRGYYNYKKYLEDPFYNLTKKYPKLFADGNIIDVGANIGYTTVVFSNALEKSYKVFAFEPHPVIFNNMALMVSKYTNSANVTRVNYAVGDEEGEIKLMHNARHHGDHQILTDALQDNIEITKIYNVPITSIDAFIEKNNIDQICFVKIDVQGYEQKVVLGMFNTIEENPNLSIALEYDPIRITALGFDPYELLEWFRINKFNLYLIENCGILKKREMESFMNTVDNNKSYVNLLFSRQVIGYNHEK